MRPPRKKTVHRSCNANVLSLEIARTTYGLSVALTELIYGVFMMKAEFCRKKRNFYKNGAREEVISRMIFSL